MGVVTGGGAAFNGGTITQPLVIAPTSDATPPLILKAAPNSSADYADILELHREDDSTFGWVTVYGELNLVSDTIDVGHGGGVVNLQDRNGNTRWLLYADQGAATPIAQAALPVSKHAGDTLGVFGHNAAAQPTLTSGTATPEQIALALQSYGAAGGT